MFSSNSSGFEKELANTRVYQFQEPVGQANVQFVQSIDQFDLEQSCLLRLKAQRQKIQELTKLYQEKEKELSQRSEHQRKLQEEIEKLSDLTQYKKSYTQLKRDFDALVKKEEATAQEFENLRKQFDQSLLTSQVQAEDLKLEIKHQKEQRILAESNWEAIVADKEEQLKKQTRRAQERQAQLSDKINKLEEQLLILSESIEEKGTQLESTSFKLRGDLKIKDEELFNYEKLVECMRKQLSEFKTKMISSQNQWQTEKQELVELIDQLKTQVKLLKRDQSEKENEIYEVKQILKRCDNKNQSLEDTVSSLKTNLKKVKDNMGNSIKQLTNSTEEEKGKLQLFVQELKAQLQLQMEEKGMLALQVKKLRGMMERRDQQEKQRKLLLMNQFRQIDKLERVVKRII